MAETLGVEGAKSSAEEVAGFAEDDQQGAIDVYVTLQHTADSVARCVDAELNERGLTTAQYGILLHLMKAKTLSLTELSELIFRSNSTITALIDRTERDGLVTRVAHAHDRRVTMVELTPEGEKVFLTVRARHRNFLADVMSVLSSEEQTKLTELLETIKHKVNQT